MSSRRSIEPASPASSRSKQPHFAPLLRFELRLKALCMASRLLPAITADNAGQERARLIDALQRDLPLSPRWEARFQRVPRDAFRLLDALRAEAGGLLGAPLYADKLDELELDLLLLDALGRPKLVRPLAARRYGTADVQAPTALGTMPLRICARRVLDNVAPAPEPQEVAAVGERSLSSLVTRLADAVRIDVSVKVEPRLAAGAATGERTVYIADRSFGQIEARRLAVHEVLGHLVAAANGRTQPLRLLEWGTAGSFVDQEGLALYLEELHGVMDAARLRVLAGRVLASEMLHGGATFADTARRLFHGEGFAAAEAVAIAERAFRGGGAARDHGYLLGWLRVHDAVARGDATVDELRSGRVSLQALPEIRRLVREGYARAPALRPSLARTAFCAAPAAAVSELSQPIARVRAELTVPRRRRP